MLPTRIIKRYMADLDGPELDQLLVSLYQHHGENLHPALPREERVRRFQEWLQDLLTKQNEEFEAMKISKFFARELLELRRAWDETRAAVIAKQQEKRDDE